MTNNLTIQGRFVSTPELKTTKDGTYCTSFSIANDDSYVPKGKERHVNFFNVEAWNKNAEFVTSYFKKGDLVNITGKIKSYKFVDKEGNEKNGFKIIAESFDFCGNKNSNPSNIPYNEPNGEYAPIDTPNDDDDGSLPF